MFPSVYRLCSDGLRVMLRRKEGLKYQKAQEWGISTVNLEWLQDVMLGHYEALRLPMAPKYQLYQPQENSFRVDYSLVPHLMAAWRIPIKLTEEIWKRFTASDAFKEAQKRKLNSVNKSDAMPTKQQRLTPELEENVPESVPTTLGDEREKAPRVLFTGLKNVVALQKGVLQLGGLLAKSPKECTHLVTSKLQRTVKLLCAFGTASFVVSPQWVTDSVAQCTFLDEKNYAVEGAEFEKTFGFNMEQVFQRTDRASLFKVTSLISLW